MTIKPLNNMVIVRMDPSKPETASGLLTALPEYWNEHSTTGTVEAVGPETNSVKEGDRVQIHSYTSSEKTRPEKIKILLYEEDIIAVL